MLNWDMTRQHFAILASLAAMAQGNAACAQGRPSPAETLADMPATAHGAPPEQWSMKYDFMCSGARYEVSLEQPDADGLERRVSITSLMTPRGPVSDEERARLSRALTPFHVVFSASPICFGQDLGLSFHGRRRADAIDSSVTAWIVDGRVARIAP